jgi:c-di-GMP-binding flagellar brake protein YcgR
MQRRRYLRIRVEFRSTFSGEQIEGEGKLMDLSLGGCRIASDVSAATGTTLELRVFVPGVDSPLRIDQARVRWARGRAWGAEFIRLPAEDLARLRQLVQDLNQ